MKIAPRMFWNAARSAVLNLFYWAFNGPITVDAQTFNTRTHTCLNCAWYERETGQCLSCLCFISLKTWLSAEKCPRGYWPRMKWTWARFRRKA